MSCPITGTAIVEMDSPTNSLRWQHADPEIHVTVELLDQADARGRAFLAATYDQGEPCPYQAGTIHFRKREA